MIIPTDSFISLLLEHVFLNFDFVDLVVRFPHLTWSEFGAASAVLISWKVLMDQLDRLALRHARKGLARLLFRLAIWLQPDVIAAPRERGEPWENAQPGGEPATRPARP